MKATFFTRHALLILMIVFFLVPFALRGGRMSLQRMKNDVKDWLPADFSETAELEWFGQHFVGERFVVATWPGCNEDDPRFQLLVEKLRGELAPQPPTAIADAADGALPEPLDPELAQQGGAAGVEQPQDAADPQQRAQQQERLRAREIGDQFGLFATGNYYEDWAGLGEKWLQGDQDFWYFITPDGELYRWKGGPDVVGLTWRAMQRTLGNWSVEREFIAKLDGSEGSSRQNEYHADPRKLTARFFNSVTTGPAVLAELSAEGGAMWPRGTSYAEEERGRIARQRALERLTGTLFGPAVPEGFSWELEQFQRQLSEPRRQQLPAGWQGTFQAFVRELVEQQYGGQRSALVQAPASERAGHWQALFQRLGVEPPPRQTCIVLTLSDPGKRNLNRVVGRPLLGKPRGKLLELAHEECGIAAGDLKLGGPPVDNVAIDEEGTITLFRLIGFSALVGLVLSFLCFRSLFVTIMVFFVGGVSAVTSLSIVWWSGASVDAVLMSMPSLVYVLGLSGAVHIVNYYRDAVHEHGLASAPERALSHGWWPCTLAAFTTSLGLLSLCASNILPIRKFGLYSAVGVMATLALLFTYLPSALQLWPPGYHRRASQGSPGGGLGMQGVLRNFWGRVGTWVVGHHGWVTAGGLVVFVAIGFGLTKINTSVQLLKLFDSDSKIIRDYGWMEANLGKLVPMELVVRVAPESLLAASEDRTASEDRDVHQEAFQFSLLERMEIADRVQRVVEEVFGEQGRDVVGRGMSAATFAPELPEASSSWRSSRGVFNRKLEENRSQILTSDYLRIDQDPAHQGSELWRVSLRLGALKDVDYGQFVYELKRAVEPVLSAYHYRDRILRGIDQQREGQGFQKARIGLLGVPDPKAAVAQEQDEPPEASTSPAGDLDQTAIFTATLRDLLTNAGFDGRNRPQWHDPQAQPLEELFPSTEDWGRTLQAYDCVVLVRDHPDYDLQQLQQHARLLIDARDHPFDPALASRSAADRNDAVQVVYTGVVPVVYKAQRTLLNSLIHSIGLAFVMIACVMMLLLNPGRSLRERLRPTSLLQGAGAGMTSMLPNVFPVVLIFGAMGHLGILVDIGAMMTASVAMGVAVDDTIHFLTWFRGGMRQGLDRKQAIVLAYQRVGAAMTQTTLIGGLGLAVFAFSTFTPTQQFGTLMLTLLVAALIGDLIFLPAILAGPLGRAFCPRPSSCPTPAAPAETPPVAAGGGQHSPLARTETPHSPLAHQSNDVVLRPDQRHG